MILAIYYLRSTILEIQNLRDQESQFGATINNFVILLRICNKKKI